MSDRELPARPNLEHLKNQARTLLNEAKASDTAATVRLSAHNIATPPKLADALHVVAREYGFESWPALKLHVEIHTADAPMALSAGIKADDAAIVREVLARHPELKTQLNQPLPGLSFDAPAIIGAAYRENREMIDALLEAGADINQRTRWWAGGFGVLDSGGPEFAEFLISRGASVDIHAAARLGKIDRVRELLAQDPTLVHARGGDGQLPLHFAANAEIAALLLDHGAEVDAHDIDHESTATQYMTSLKPHRHEVARFLIARGAKTDLLMAAALGDHALVESILNEDPETLRITVSERSLPKRNPRSGGSIYFFGFGWTKSPHMLAREFNHPRVFDLLMQRSPAWLRLINAAEGNDDVLVRDLLAKHPQLFAKLTPNAGRRIIGTAVRNNTAAVRLLLQAGWPAAAAMETAQTALHFAAFHGNAEMTHDLLAHGAAVDAVETEHGGNPLAWALRGSEHSWHRERGDYPAVVRALLNAGAKLPAQQSPQDGAAELLDIVRSHDAAPASP